MAATERNRTDAETVELEHRKSILQGRTWSPRLTVRRFPDAAAEFLTAMEVEHRDTPSTWKRLVTSFASLKVFWQVPVGAITSADIERYKIWRVTKHGVRDITLRHDLHALSKFFRWAIRHEYARENPVAAAGIPSDADAVRIHVITTEEETAYFAHAKGNLADCATIILNQGMRPEEVLALKKADVDLERSLIHVRQGKTKAARRTLRMTEEVRIILARRMDSKSQWCFPSKPPHRHLVKLNGAHDRVLKATGLAFVLYDFRHTFATRMAQAGIDLATLAAILGHNGLRTVMKYVHPTQHHQDAAMLRFDALRRESRLPTVVQ